MPSRKRRKQPRWSGSLAKPIKWDGPAFFGPEPRRGLLAGFIGETAVSAEEHDEHARQWYEAYRQVIAKRAEKFGTLAEHYNVSISNKNWQILLLDAICQDLIPGFQIDLSKNVAGRRRKWTDVHYLELMADVEAIKREKSCGDSEACNNLVTRICTKASYKDRYGSSVGTKKQQALSLNSRLVEARNPHLKWNKVLKVADFENIPSHRIDILIACFALDFEQARQARTSMEGRQQHSSD